MQLKDKIKEVIVRAKIDTNIYTLIELASKLSERLGTEVKPAILAETLKEMNKETLPANNAGKEAKASAEKSATKKEQILSALGAIETTGKTAAQINEELASAGIVISEGTAVKYLQEAGKDFVKGGGESKSAKIEITLATAKESLEGKTLKEAVEVVEAACGTVSAATVAKYAAKVGINFSDSAAAAPSKSAKITAIIAENKEEYLAIILGDPKGGYKAVATAMTALLGEEVSPSSVKARLTPTEAAAE